MGLADSQRFLARLATDADLRARFADDPDGVAAEFGLSPAECQSFGSLLPGPIAGFAGSLIRKRRGELESLLPLTFRSLEPGRFAALFRRHAAEYVPSGIKKHRDDAVAFAAFLAREVAEPPWLGDLARLEATVMIAHDPAHRATSLRLKYHPAQLARAEADAKIKPKPCLVLWFRITPRRRLQRWIFVRPW